MDLITLFLNHLELLLIIFARITGLLITAPIFSNRLVPVQVNGAIAMVLAMIVVPLMGPGSLPQDMIHLIPIAIKELAVGMTIGFVVLLLFAAVQLAGELIDINAGFSMMAIINPLSDFTLPVLGNLKYTIALLVFLALDGHHLLLQAVVQSYALVPINGFTFSAALWSQLSELMVGVFLLALQIAAPTLAALFITDVTLGITNRALPQMNVFVVGMPLKVGVALGVLILAMPLYVTILQAVLSHLGQDILVLLRLMGGGTG